MKTKKNASLNERFCRVLEGLEETLGELEEHRKRELPRVTLLAILFIVPLSVFLFFLALESPPFGEDSGHPMPLVNLLLGLVLLFSMPVSFMYCVQNPLVEELIRKFILKDYVASFKGKIIKKIFNLLGSNVSYAPEKGISEEQFYESLLFTKNDLRSESLEGDDFTQVQIGKTEITFSELHLSSGSGKHKINIFGGLFFIADVKKSLNVPIGTRSNLGKQQIKTDSPEFNKYFSIYSDDRISVFEALSNSFLEKLIEFKDKNEIDFDFSFVGNKAYFAIHYPSEMTLFEPPVWKTLFNPEIYENFLLDIQLIYDLIETLELER